MIDDDDIPAEGVFTDQRIWGLPAKLWWQQEVMRAFPKVEDRLKVLEPLEAAMIRYGTTTLLYHLEEVAGHYVTFDSAEDEEFIYVNVSLGGPILIDLPEELLRELN
ncbi:hypothetical protein [Tabrizicola sp.]|uniref:hypothetical protein n=1 Tax=Tabrizicola sp. TaxID=2005166 RepID=UPI0027362787|nr:hypothetical protein [Tabrizicola sp.]MDP3196935.1 hypothetical protein [Tabrizicola sp.]